MDIKQSSEKRFALLIDADNVSAKYIKPITDELSKYGTVTYKRIYGDWTLTLHGKWKEALLENSITPIQQFGYTQGKNATDSAMIIDAMDILYTRSVEGFCIVSSDSDFTRLASRIRESGLTVIGMGEKKTPTPFRKACDIFTTLELLLGESSPSGRSGGRGKGRGEQPSAASAQSAGGSSIGKDEIEQAVANIITDNLNNGKSTGLGEVGSRLLKRYPDFDVRSYGTNQLKKLLDEFDSVVITKDGSSVTVELAEDRDASAKDSAKGATRDAGSKIAEGSAPSKDVLADAAGAAASASKAAEDAAVAAGPAASKPKPAAGKAADAKPADAESAEGAEPAAKAIEGSADAAEVASSFPEAKPASRRSPRRRRERAAGGRTVASSKDAVGVAEAGKGSAEPSAAALTEGSGSGEGSSPSAAKGASKRARASKRASLPAPAAATSSAPADVAPSADAPVSGKGLPGTEETPDRFIRQTVRESGAEGVNLADLGKRVRAKYRSFKVRDLGYTQFRSYVADIDDVEIEKRGKSFFARLAD